MKKYKSLLVAMGVLVSFGIVLLQAGCVPNQRRHIAETVGKTAVRPFFEAVKAQQWQTAQQYLADDVQLTGRGQQGIGRAFVVEWLKNSPLRKFSDVQWATTVLEVRPDNATVKFDFIGNRESTSGTEFLKISLRVKVIKKEKQWLIHELIYDTFEIL